MIVCGHLPSEQPSQAGPEPALSPAVEVLRGLVAVIHQHRQ